MRVVDPSHWQQAACQARQASLKAGFRGTARPLGMTCRAAGPDAGTGRRGGEQELPASAFVNASGAQMHARRATGGA